MPKTVADYEDAVRRITRKEVDPNATTKAEVRQALRSADVPQLTDKVIDNFVDAIVTEDRVIQAIEENGELPSSREIDDMVELADDYQLDDRVEAVAQEVHDTVATVEDVRTAVAANQPSDRPMLREDVESAVDQVADQKVFAGESPDEVASEQAREVGAPSRSDYEDAQREALSADTVTPAKREDIPNSSDTPVSVIRDESGDPVLAVGIGAGAEAVAEETGAEAFTGSPQDLQSEMEVSGSGETADITLRGQKIGEVPIE